MSRHLGTVTNGRVGHGCDPARKANQANRFLSEQLAVGKYVSSS